jgi:hypothetical protein
MPIVVGMDWHCSVCRREGTRWFLSQIKGDGQVDYGVHLELAEADHFLSGCKGRLVRDGGIHRDIFPGDIERIEEINA